VNKQHHVLCVVGTRPEAIKMAPVIRALRESSWARCTVIATAQQRGLLDQALERFGIVPDIDLDIMTEGQSLASLTARLTPVLSEVISAQQPDIVLAQGDTATVFITALVSFYARIPFGHIEAGLRTYNLDQPYPEEAFRQMVGRIACWHFAPTATAAANLRREGISERCIFITGNTGIDTLLQVATACVPIATKSERMILLTVHRRENFGEPLLEIFAAVRALVERYPDVRVVYPIHPNPNIKTAAYALLGGHERIDLRMPLDYFEFVELMSSSYLILTDSGGIQEEAPALAKPVLVLRQQTERPEAVEFGVARLIGTDQSDIFAAASELLDDTNAYSKMAQRVSPYGDGHASERIVELLRKSVLEPGTVDAP